MIELHSWDDYYAAVSIVFLFLLRSYLTIALNLMKIIFFCCDQPKHPDYIHFFIHHSMCLGWRSIRIYSILFPVDDQFLFLINLRIPFPTFDDPVIEND